MEIETKNLRCGLGLGKISRLHGKTNASKKHGTSNRIMSCSVSIGTYIGSVVSIGTSTTLAFIQFWPNPV